MRRLMAHVRQTLGEKRGNSEALASIRDFLTARLGEARAKDDQVQWLAHDSTWRVDSWDRWRNFTERQDAKQASENLERMAREQARRREQERQEGLVAKLLT